MIIDTGTSEPVSQKPFPIAIKHYKWIKDEINKLLMVKVIWLSQSSWSAPIIVVPKGDGGKCLVIDYCTLNKVTQKFIWPMPKVEDIFSQLNRAKYFSTLDLQAGYHCSNAFTFIFPWMSPQYPKQHSPHHLENMNTSKYLLDLCKHQHISKNIWQVS